ncbi:BMC domain-containing protein [Desulfosediminicola sp.]|uniref:BMC domain-containing protein n=1 Tax=Desulfosediminicola sp. TaxID=2886825 RepID=UPI003AF28A35
MDLRTIGCVEVNSVAWGMHVADEMIKAASVQLVMARTTCPGRYVIVVAGDTGAIQSSVEAGCKIAGDMAVDWFTIASVHHDVIPALNASTLIPRINALGVIETMTISACILAADGAAKAGDVDLIEIRMAAGLAGKAYVTMTGDVGSVNAAVEAGIAAVGDSGPLHSHVVIPSPSNELKAHLL